MPTNTIQKLKPKTHQINEHQKKKKKKKKKKHHQKHRKPKNLKGEREY